MSGSRWSPANFGVNVPGSRGQTATGTNQATAFQLTQQVTVFSTVASGTGCALPGSFASGTNPTIINRGANNLTIYPAPNDQIEDGSVGAGFTLAPNTSVQFTSFDAPAAPSPRTWWESGGYTKGNLGGYLPLAGGTMTGPLGVSLTQTASSQATLGWLKAVETFHGSIPGVSTFGMMNSFIISDDLSFTGSPKGIGQGLYVQLNSGGASMSGGRNAIQGDMVITATSGNSGNGQYVALQGNAFLAGSVSDPGAIIYGGNSTAQLFAGASVGTGQVVAHEFNSGGGALTVAAKYVGVGIVPFSSWSVAGTGGIDTALAFGDQNGLGWDYLMDVRSGFAGHNALKTTGTIFNWGSASTIANGIDIHLATITGNAWRSTTAKIFGADDVNGTSISLSGGITLGTTHTSGQAVNILAANFSPIILNGMQVSGSGSVLIGSGTVTGLPYQFQTAINADPSAALALERRTMFNTTLSYASNSTHTWEGLTQFTAISGPGHAQGEVNGIHSYFQFNADATISATENFEASMNNSGSIPGSHVGYLAISHNLSAGIVPGYIFGAKYQLTNDNTAVGAIANYAAIDNEAMGGAGSAPTFYYFIRNADPAGGISSLGPIALGTLGTSPANLLAIFGSDNSVGTFPLKVISQNGNISLVIGNDNTTYFANLLARIDGDGKVRTPSLDTISGGLTIGATTATGVALGKSGGNLGFFGTAPIAKPTGVAVTAAGIHAALVSLGVIAP